MRGFNRVIIAGNLTRDPDVRVTVNKNTYARFSVAINSARRNENGEIQESTEYVNVVVWGAQAENCGKYLKKGSAVLIEGRLQTSSYEARDGSGKRYSTEVVASNVMFLSGGNSQNSGSSQWNRGNSYQPARQSSNDASNYSQPPAFDPATPPVDESFGKSIGESGFGGFEPSFLGGEDASDIPF